MRYSARTETPRGVRLAAPDNIRTADARRRAKARTATAQLGLTLVAILALSMPPCAKAEDEGDFDYWAKASFLFPINERWSFGFDEKFNFIDDGAQLDKHQTDLRFNYSGLADWLIIGIGYKQAFGRDAGGWQKERRPWLHVTAKTQLWGLDVSDRSRFEYRDEDDEDTVWRYRNKVTVRPAVTLTRLKIQPYVAEEIFVQFDEEDFNKHRVYGGFYIPLCRQIRLELFYIWEIDEEPDSWHDTNILGSYVRFTF